MVSPGRGRKLASRPRRGRRSHDSRTMAACEPLVVNDAATVPGSLQAPRSYDSSSLTAGEPGMDEMPRYVCAYPQNSNWISAI